MRKHEWKWIKYKLDSCWQAYKVGRNTYYTMLNNKKRNVLRSSIEDCSKHSRKLHALITNVTTSKLDNLWPKHKSKQELADGFAHYFHNKILLIKEPFKDTAPYQPNKVDVPKPKGICPLCQRMEFSKSSTLLRVSLVNWMSFQQASSRYYSQQSCHSLPI